MQKAADTAVRDHVNPTDQAIGGLAMDEPGTGEVRALAQSRPKGADRALSRRNTVLDRMAQLNVLTQEKADKLKDRPLGLKPEKSPNGCQQSQAPFFCDYVVNYLMTDKSLGETKKDRKRLLQSGGLTIHTTLDLDYQKASDRAVSG
jgi:membrane peptidoglycan carboxypeptidase